jgi:hypothetical protein
VDRTLYSKSNALPIPKRQLALGSNHESLWAAAFPWRRPAARLPAGKSRTPTPGSRPLHKVSIGRVWDIETLPIKNIITFTAASLYLTRAASLEEGRRGLISSMRVHCVSANLPFLNLILKRGAIPHAVPRATEGGCPRATVASQPPQYTTRGLPACRTNDLPFIYG